MIPHRCPTCSSVKDLPEINDDGRIEEKFRLDELVRIQGRGLPVYRILKLDGMQMLLEKL
jgi:hypothetical protein